MDMLSKLPDRILQSILSDLTTEEVIRTSILSKRWRYLWTSIPSIDIDYSPGQKINPLDDDFTDRCRIKKFEEFVYWVLATNSSYNLDSFSLSFCWESFSLPTVWQWIRIAVMRRVKQLDLDIHPLYPKDIELPYFLVTCATLEVLRLSSYHHRLTFPLLNSNITVFPALRVLELNDVQLTDGGLLQHFLDSCAALEELSFTYCILYKLGYLNISCPNLKKLAIVNWYNDDDGADEGFLYSGVWISCPKLEFLEFEGHIADTFSFQTSLDSLKKAVIHPEDLDHHQISYDPRADTIRTLIAQFSHAQFLSLSLYFIKKLDVPVSLPNLKTLELTISLDADIMDALIKFLICVPHLESLYLIITEGFLTDKHWNLDEEEARKIFAPRLKRVEFLDFKGGKRKLVLVRSLLTHGNVLEALVFFWGKCRRDKSMKTMKNVSKVRKASLNVKLINHFTDSTTHVIG